MRWPSSIEELMLARDKLSCQQQGGTRGPPFAPAAQLTLGRALARWLPWNWFSLDGTGWCYDASWDELLRCEDVRTPVDWNGVSQSRAPGGVWLGAPRAPELLLVACAAFAAAAVAAYSTHQARQARSLRDSDDSGGAAPARPAGLGDWVRHAARPWRWERSAQSSLACSLAGLALGACLPSLALPP